MIGIIAMRYKQQYKFYRMHYLTRAQLKKTNFYCDELENLQETVIACLCQYQTHQRLNCDSYLLNKKAQL